VADVNGICDEVIVNDVIRSSRLELLLPDGATIGASCGGTPVGSGAFDESLFDVAVEIVWRIEELVASAAGGGGLMVDVSAAEVIAGGGGAPPAAGDVVIAGGAAVSSTDSSSDSTPSDSIPSDSEAISSSPPSPPSTPSTPSPGSPTPSVAPAASSALGRFWIHLLVRARALKEAGTEGGTFKEAAREERVLAPAMTGLSVWVG
jgi:hypothetical protein